jgi:hypothetical protein
MCDHDASMMSPKMHAAFAISPASRYIPTGNSTYQAKRAALAAVITGQSPDAVHALALCGSNFANDDAASYSHSRTRSERAGNAGPPLAVYYEYDRQPSVARVPRLLLRRRRLPQAGRWYQPSVHLLLIMWNHEGKRREEGMEYLLHHEKISCLIGCPATEALATQLIASDRVVHIDIPHHTHASSPRKILFY